MKILLCLFYLFGSLLGSENVRELTIVGCETLLPDSVKTNETGSQLPLPQNGFVKYYTFDDPVAPLKIVTSSYVNFYVKLENSQTGELVLSAFIRKGQSAELNVPLGKYIIKYATGKKWFGEKLLFGCCTEYYKLDDLFDFRVEGNQYMGYTVELFLQTDGNLDIVELDEGQF